MGKMTKSTGRPKPIDKSHGWRNRLAKRAGVSVAPLWHLEADRSTPPLPTISQHGWRRRQEFHAWRGVGRMNMAIAIWQKRKLNERNSRNPSI